MIHDAAALWSAFRRPATSASPPRHRHQVRAMIRRVRDRWSAAWRPRDAAPHRSSLPPRSVRGCGHHRPRRRTTAWPCPPRCRL